MTPFSIRYRTQAEEINRRYNEMYGRTNVEFNYDGNDKEIYKMLDYLDEKRIKVGDDAIRLYRSFADFTDKYDPLKMIGLR